MCNHDFVSLGCLECTRDILDQLGDLRLEVLESVVSNIGERFATIVRNALENVDELVDDSAGTAVVLVVSSSEGSESSDSSEENVLELHFGDRKE